MFDFDIYNNSAEILKRKEESIYLKFIISLIVISLMVLIMMFRDYDDIHDFNGVVIDGEIVVYVNDDSIQYFDDDVIVLKNEETNYKISDIKRVNDSKSQINYQLSIHINQDLNENDVVNFNINKGKTNLYKSFIKKIWKGFG